MPVRHNALAMKQELAERVVNLQPERSRAHQTMVTETIHKLREISCAGNDTPDHVNEAAEAKLTKILFDFITEIEASAVSESSNGEGSTGELALEQLPSDASGQAKIAQIPNFQSATE